MKIKNVLILIGAPGSGKGTQGKLLAPILKYNYLSMGNTLRKYSKSKEPDATEIKKTIDGGHIIREDLFKKIFKKTVNELPKADGLILDGFPRDISQTSVLDELISDHKVDKVKVIFIDVPKIKLINRLQSRGSIESRADDDPEIIETRFKEYEEKTFPLLEYFRKHHWMSRVDGDQEVEYVHAEILTKLSHGKISI